MRCWLYGGIKALCQLGLRQCRERRIFLLPVLFTLQFRTTVAAELQDYQYRSAHLFARYHILLAQRGILFYSCTLIASTLPLNPHCCAYFKYDNKCRSQPRAVMFRGKWMR